eukprot:g2831.t1
MAHSASQASQASQADHPRYVPGGLLQPKLAPPLMQAQSLTNDAQEAHDFGMSGAPGAQMLYGSASPEHQQRTEAVASKFRRTAIPADEQRGLDDLYRQTLGTKWKNQQGWAKQEREDRPAACYGVTVEPVGTSEGWTAPDLRHGNVVRLQLDFNGLRGSALPESLGNFGCLRELVLFGNPVGGTLPDSLGLLGALEKLLIYGTM